MKTLSRRDLLKSSLLAPAAVAASSMGPMGAALQAAGVEPALQPAGAEANFPVSGADRERLLLDFGWRFHLGNANDPSKDFDFGLGRSGTFQKTGNFLSAGSIAFDDGDWRTIDLPHDWAIELPFQNDPALASKGFYPLHKCRMVSPRLRAFRGGRSQANHHRVRRFLSGDDGSLQRLLHRPPQRRIRSIQF
jgi:beta-galactosidase